MSLALTIADQRAIAEQVLTVKQLNTWELCVARNLSRNHAAQLLGVSRQAVDHAVRTSERKIIAHLKGARTTRPREPQRNPSLALQLLIQRDGPRCYLCHTALKAEELTIDHIIPTALGGGDHPQNTAVACFPCNTSKGARLVSLETTSGRPVYHHPQA